jgi:hypothetical protein
MRECRVGNLVGKRVPFDLAASARKSRSIASAFFAGLPLMM